MALVLLAFRGRRIVESIVTSAAIADAREKLAKLQPYGLTFEGVWEPVASELARAWAFWFEAGYLDRRLLLEKLASARDALESLMVIVAFHQAVEEDGVGPPGIVTWFEAVAQSPEAKDLLVDTFLGALTWLPPCQDVPMSWNMMKMMLFTVLFSPPKDGTLPSSSKFLVLSTDMQVSREGAEKFSGWVPEAAWRSIARDTGASREKTRAGAFLLLFRHPEPGVFEAEARRALGDPSQVVRLAAAGTLALKQIDAGERILLEGMGHESWEIRFWCLQALAVIGKTTPLLLEQQLKVESDQWLISILEELAERARRARK